MATEGNQDVLKQRVVDATIQLHGGIDATHLVRTIDLIRLRQVLRELCVACGAWSCAVESVFQADVAALRKLEGMDAPPQQEACYGCST
jgi:hypothetical protein